MTHFASDLRLAAMAVCLCFYFGSGCVVQESRLPSLDRATSQYAELYTGGIVARRIDTCDATAIDSQNDVVVGDRPDAIVEVSDVWMLGDMHNLPVVTSLLPDIEEENAFYVTFQRLVVDESVILECGGQRMTEALLAQNLHKLNGGETMEEIGRASCRERV